jgi:hypothetical protein
LKNYNQSRFISSGTAAPKYAQQATLVASVRKASDLSLTLEVMSSTTESAVAPLTAAYPDVADKAQHATPAGQE